MIRFMRNILVVLILLTAAAVLSLEFIFLQATPRLDASLPPAPEDVATTRDLVRNIRSAAGAETVLETDVAQLNSAITLGARFVDDFRGRVTIRENQVLGEASLPVPWWDGTRWLNVTGQVPEFDTAFSLRSITVGPVDLPPAPALALARISANLMMGNRFGDRVLEAASSMQIREDTLLFRIALDDVGKNGVMSGAFGTLRGADMPGPEEIEEYHHRIRTAMADGTLKQTGSFMPYIQFTLQAALEGSTEETLPNAYTAAVFGLAKACGARDFSMIVGRLAFDTTDFETTWSTSCSEVTFNGRPDTRRHFITAAALQAASNTGVSVSIGEFKELYDTISGAGGFDFTDMAANRSGIAMSDAMMAAPPDAWPRILAGLESENDVIIPFDGIPQLMLEAEFKARFGNVESEAYKEMIAQIEQKIRALDLHMAQ